jgi:hypothetical protein
VDKPIYKDPIIIEKPVYVDREVEKKIEVEVPVYIDRPVVDEEWVRKFHELEEELGAMMK